MNDERVEQLLKGYRLPEVSARLDAVVLREGAAVLAGAPARASGRLAAAGLTVLNGLGFGYLGWLVDLLADNETEYSVEVA